MHLKFENLTRQESDPARISKLKSKGWSEFTPEVVPEAPPADAPVWAFRAALRMDGILDAVNTAIAAMPENRKIVSQERLAGGDVIARKDSLIRYLNENVAGINKAKLDALFVNANEIAVRKVGA